MDTQITEFINILSDNKLVVKYYKVPDDIDETTKFSEYEFEEDPNSEVEEYSIERFKESIENEWLSPDSLMYFELNGFRRPFDLEDFLISNFEKFKIAFNNNKYSNEIDVKKEIVNQVRAIKNQLDNLLNNSKLVENYVFESLIKVKIEICTESIRFINYAPVIIINQTVETPIKPNVTLSRVRIRRPSEKLTDLTQNQIVILFHYLREHGYIGKDTTNTLYAGHISELTGFAAEKIRQDLSHISNNFKSADSREFLDYEYSAVKRALNKVIASIEKYSEEHFPS